MCADASSTESPESPQGNLSVVAAAFSEMERFGTTDLSNQAILLLHPHVEVMQVAYAIQECAHAQILPQSIGRARVAHPEVARWC